MGTLGDLLVLGEGPSVVADADVDLLGMLRCVKVKKTNFDFWANVHRKREGNSNFPQ